MNVEFYGPFSWIDGKASLSIFNTDVGKESGVYLWTVNIEKGELIYYVGQTGRHFAQRMLEHFREHMSGGYHLYDPQEFRHGRKALLWPGRYGLDRESSLSKFVQHFQDLAPALVDLAGLYRFYLAPLACERRLRERIEAGIAEYLYQQPGMIGEFQDQGIRYHPRRDNEESIQILIQCQANLIGLPGGLWI